MTVRLKDRELQKKLDEISGGDFSQKLQEKPTSSLSPNFVEVGFSREKGKIVRCFTATFRIDEIEKVPEFDPNDWNRFPEVTPPEDELMRLEVTNPKSLRHIVYRYAAKFKNGEWVKDCTENSVLIGDFDAVRFRPWGDPDDQEEEKAERAGGTD